MDASNYTEEVVHIKFVGGLKINKRPYLHAYNWDYIFGRGKMLCEITVAQVVIFLGAVSIGVILAVLALILLDI